MAYAVFRHPKLERILMIAAGAVLMAASSVAAEPPFVRTENRRVNLHDSPVFW